MVDILLNVRRLRGFPSELLELPLQSSRCFLADIKPPKYTEEPMMDNGCWPLNTMEALIQLVAGKKLVAKTVVRTVSSPTLDFTIMTVAGKIIWQ